MSVTPKAYIGYQSANEAGMSEGPASTQERQNLDTRYQLGLLWRVACTHIEDDTSVQAGCAVAGHTLAQDAAAEHGCHMQGTVRELKGEWLLVSKDRGS
jgi:hypothetical protein